MLSTHFNGFSLLALKLISRRANAENDRFSGLPEIRQSNGGELEGSMEITENIGILLWHLN
jgi:hypothetical protein